MTLSAVSRCAPYVVTTLVALGVGGCEVGSPCGGTTGDSCLPGTFCKSEAGSCDDPEAIGICTLVPVTCTLVFLAVCGCNGWTYGNECMADAAGVPIDHFGACVQPCCDPTEEPGVGDDQPCVEGATCCADGQWQCNLGDGASSCDAAGEVCRVCGGIAGLPCGESEFCKLDVGECCCDFQGLCMPLPDVCIEIFAPVCGCDGQTYSNSCFADVAGVSIDHEGECEDVGSGGG